MIAKRFAMLSGLAIFAATTLALHFLQPTQSARDDAVSYYVHGNHGWLLTIGLLKLRRFEGEWLRRYPGLWEMER